MLCGVKFVHEMLAFVEVKSYLTPPSTPGSVLST